MDEDRAVLLARIVCWCLAACGALVALSVILWECWV
jgi:hypothetical protein